ncbi:MAG: hypothetical protein V2A67_06925 [Bacteroidota bacterium]
MKNIFISFIISLLPLFLFPTALSAQKIAVFSFPVEIELTNDQGEMSTRDYLKNYGTKGRKRGPEYIYKATVPFIITQFAKTGKTLLTIDTLSTLKDNEYGYPSASLAKAIETGIADQYIRIHLKDIAQVELEGVVQLDPQTQQKKIVKMRCRLQIYDKDKNLIFESTGEFQSGEKVENAAELGVDLRRIESSAFDQELKVYETCAKMAILRAMKLLVH